MRFSKKVLCIISITVILLSLYTPVEISAEDSGSDGSWCKIFINQSNSYAPSGCTMCTIINIIQNSGLISDSSNQAKAGSYGGTKKDAEFDKIFNKMYARSTNSEWSFRVIDQGLKVETQTVPLMNKYCEGANWKVQAEGVKGTGNWTCTVGVNGKPFNKMSDKELLDAFKMFWNNGYWGAIGLQSTSDPQNWSPEAKDGSGNIYQARHWVMWSGVNDKDIYFNDSAGGTTSSKFGKYKGYKLQYVVLFKNDKAKMIDVAGGKKCGVTGSANDKSTSSSSSNSLGVPNAVFGGYCGENEISQYCMLSEANIDAQYIEYAKRDSLTSKETGVLSDWEMNVDMGEESNGLIGFLRQMTQLFGILFTVWMILIYLAYWWDRLNTFIDLDLLGILTFKKLVISPDESECTFSVSNNSSAGGEARTVNHKTLLKICITGLAFGCLIISGTFYKILSIIIFKITSFLR